MESNDKGLIFSLLETSRFSNELICREIKRSLSAMGKEHPDLVLSDIYNYIINAESPLTADSLTCLYEAADSILKKNVIKNKSIVEKWITKSINTITSPMVPIELKYVVVHLLANLVQNRIEHRQVMDGLLMILKEDAIPSVLILNTLYRTIYHPKDIYTYLKDILNKIVPMMSFARHESHRKAILDLLKKIAQDLLELSANNDPKIQINLEEYEESFSSSYEILLNSWYKVSTLSIKYLIIETLSYMSSLINIEKLKEFCTPTIHTILIGYKKNANPFRLSLSLAIFCSTFVKKGIEDCLKCHIESTLATLINQACVTIDYNEIATVKNYGEVLRCYEIFAGCFPESVIPQVLQRLENASHVQRTGALAVLKHLINGKRVPEAFMSRIFATLNMILPDTNSKVIKNMSQIILSLGSKGHLMNETGQPFIDYLVQHAAGGRLEPKGRIDLADVCNEPAKDVCWESLILLATTIPSTVQILWPHMLHYLMNSQYEESLPVTLKCLANLADFDEAKPNSNGPSIFKQLTPVVLPEAVLLKLLTLSCMPNKSAIGADCLDLLNGLACHISPDIISSWSDHLPSLKVQYNTLCSNISEPMALEKFQSSLKHFLESTVKTMKNETFTENLICTLKCEIERYDKNQPYHCFLMSLMGVCLKYVVNTSLATSTLEFLYNAVNHRSSADQECFSTAVGMCASTNSSIVFSKIEGWLKCIDSIKRSILSLLKAQDSRIEEQSFLKVSVVHCLGQIAVLAASDHVEETVGGPVMLHLLNIINNNKIDIVNETVMQTISKIGRALLKVPSINLRQRPILITHIINTMKQEDISPIAISGCLQAMRDIVALQPELDVEERALVLQTSISSCLSKLDVKSETDLHSNLINCYSILNVLIRTVVQHDPQMATLDDIITLLRPTINSPSKILRMKAIDLVFSSLATYQQHVIVQPNSLFTYKAQFLAIVVPRLNDSYIESRITAFSCFKLIVKIADKYSGHPDEFIDIAQEAIQILQSKINSKEAETIRANLRLIGDVICYKLSLDELAHFLNDANIGLQDKDEESACGVAQILSALFNTRGSQMQHFYPKNILEPIYKRLQKVTDPATRYYTIEAICNYAQFKVTRFSNILATFPIPFEPAICETFQRMGGSTEMCINLLTHFTQILERTPPYAMQNTANGDRVKIANLLPLSVICAMKEIFNFHEVRNRDDERGHLLRITVEENDVKNTKMEINNSFASLFPLLVLWYGSYVDCLAPLHQTDPSDGPAGFIPNREATTVIPARCVLECILSYLSASGYCNALEGTVALLLKTTDIDTFDSFENSITELITEFVITAPEKISSLVAYLDTHHTYEMQRMTVASVFGSLISTHCNGDFDLLEIVIASLISRIHDESINVRRIAIRGLASFDQDKVPDDFEKSSEVLSTLVSAAELRNNSYLDVENEVIVDALMGLSNLLQNMKFKDIKPHVITLFSKVRMFIEKSPELRDSVTAMMLALVNAIEPSQEYKEIIHTHLLGTLLHLLDPHAPVAISCKLTLLQLDKHLTSEPLRHKLSEHLSIAEEIDFPDFIEAIGPHLVEEFGNYTHIFIRSAMEYYNHSCPSMRTAAAYLTANVVCYADDLDLAIVKKSSLGLIALLKDSSPDVVNAAVRAIALYKKYVILL